MHVNYSGYAGLPGNSTNPARTSDVPAKRDLPQSSNQDDPSAKRTNRGGEMPAWRSDALAKSANRQVQSDPGVQPARHDPFYAQHDAGMDFVQDLSLLRASPGAIGKDHPLYCLTHVAKSRELPQNLLALYHDERYPALRDKLVEAVHSPNWHEQPIFSHRFMGEQFPDHEVAPLIENLVTLASYEGALSSAEQAAINELLVIKEQFSGEKASIYRTGFAIPPGSMERIRGSKIAQDKLQEIVAAVRSGKWGASVFNGHNFLSEAGEKITLRELLVFAKREGKLDAPTSRLAFTWADARHQHAMSENGAVQRRVITRPTATPALYAEPDKTVMDHVAKSMQDPTVARVAKEMHTAFLSGDIKSPVFSRTYLYHQTGGIDKLPSGENLVQWLRHDNKIDDEQFQAMMLCVSMRAQYGERFTGPDTRANAAKETTWVQLPAARGNPKVTARPLFDAEGEPTREAKQYLKELVCLPLSRSSTFACGSFKPDYHDLMAQLRGLPKHLQIFVEIGNFDFQANRRSVQHENWLGQLLDTPLLAAGKPKSRDEVGSIFAPSIGIEREFHRLFWINQNQAGVSDAPPEDNMMVSQVFLGRLGNARRDALNLEGTHPVLSFHPDVADNFVEPHKIRAAAAFARWHDKYFHTLRANLLAPLTRTALTKVLPDFIRGMDAPRDEYEASIRETLIDELNDLKVYQDIKNKNGTEANLALLSEIELVKFREKYIADPATGKRQELPQQVSTLRFYFHLLRRLTDPQHALPAPFGPQADAAEDSKTLPVFSGDWGYLGNVVKPYIEAHWSHMQQKGAILSAEGAKLMEEYYSYTGKPPEALDRMRRMLGAA